VEGLPGIVEEDTTNNQEEGHLGNIEEEVHPNILVGGLPNNILEEGDLLGTLVVGLAIGTEVLPEDNTQAPHRQ